MCDADVDDKETFADVVGTEQRYDWAESEGFTFTDALLRANLFSKFFWRVSSVHPNGHYVSLQSSFSLGVFRNKMMAIHSFLKLVNSARPNMMMASWGFCVLVLNCSGQRAACLGRVFVCFLGEFGSEFEVGRAPFCDEVPRTVQGSPMEFASSLWQYLHCV